MLTTRSSPRFTSARALQVNHHLLVCSSILQGHHHVVGIEANCSGDENESACLDGGMTERGATGAAHPEER
jgi:hypothetical protein